MDDFEILLPIFYSFIIIGSSSSNQYIFFKNILHGSRSSIACNAGYEYDKFEYPAAAMAAARAKKLLLLCIEQQDIQLSTG
jgi:hypothetical protein